MSANTTIQYLNRPMHMSGTVMESKSSSKGKLVAGDPQLGSSRSVQ